jgi:hypothetical protein
VAPTDNDHNAEEWLLLCDARALVARYCKSETAAERLLLEFARKGQFLRYRFYQSDARDKAIFHPADTRDKALRGIDPRIWGSSNDAVRVIVD